MTTESSSPVLFRMTIATRWRDLDAFNHVNNANFLTFLEEARIRWFQAIGKEWFNERFAPLLAAVHINYRTPIPYPVDVFVELFAEKIGSSSITIGHRIVGGDNTLFADGYAVMVWIDLQTQRPAALPDSIREAAGG